MKLQIPFFIIALIAAAIPLYGQSKYSGALFTKLGQEIKGEITVNLEGSNNELIEITSTEITKSKGKRQSITTTSKINVALIRHVTINDQIYYFRDIKIGYNDEYMRNVCVKLIWGKIDCGLFQFGDGTASHSISIKFPTEELSKLASVDFEYYHTSISVQMRISKCESLVEKMLVQNENVTWSESNSREQRISRIKNIITEYNGCKLSD